MQDLRSAAASRASVPPAVRIQSGLTVGAKIKKEELTADEQPDSFGIKSVPTTGSHVCSQTRMKIPTGVLPDTP